MWSRRSAEGQSELHNWEERFDVFECDMIVGARQAGFSKVEIIQMNSVFHI